MKHALILILAALISACGNMQPPTSLISLQQAFFPAPADASYALELPYASIKVGFKGMEALLVLAEIRGDEYIWLSSRREALVTRHGRIVRTTLQQDDLLGTRVSPQDPLLKGYIAAGLYGVNIDLYHARHYNLWGKGHWQCEDEKEPVELVATSVALTHCTETLSWDTGATTTNHFWLDERKEVWRSLQTPFPGSPSYDVTLVKSLKEKRS